MQPDLFSTIEHSTGLGGTPVLVSGRCKYCASTLATLTSTAGPHHAGISCDGCGRHRGWLPSEASDFLNSLIDQFGKPSAPIAISWPRGRQ